MPKLSGKKTDKRAILLFSYSVFLVYYWIVFYKDNMLPIAYIVSNLIDLEVQGTKKMKRINNEKIF